MLSMRKDPFVIGQYYHIYNRGTDKRVIFMDKFDLWRFLQSMDEFNTLEPIGSIFENKYNKKGNDQLGSSTSKLVDIICYCVNPNHYHFILSPLVENGIEKFMQRLGTGFTKYFNEKYKRNGVLFQGRYKSIFINSDEYLIYLSAYINLNNKIHLLGSSTSKSGQKGYCKSSWEEFLGEIKENVCNKNIILDRYGNVADYKEFAESVAEGIVERRIDENINLSEDLLIEKLT